jgi:translation initiation factor 2B subunit (eIF-2B alpha/beta/delta family)
MSTEQQFIDKIAADFTEGTIVPIIGAGCSARQDDDTGRSYRGFPLAREFVDGVRAKSGYLQDVTNFYEATVLIENRQGRGTLLSELHDAYSPAQRLPIYDTLALLPFDTAVSFNFDESLEASLTAAGRTYATVVRDEDVPLSLHSPVTVVKPHGTVGRRDSLRATRGRVTDFDRECPLVGSLLEILLANRSPLFLGYGFGDHDIMNSIQRVRSWVGNSYSTRGTAVILASSPSLEAELVELQIDVLTGNAANVLGDVAARYVERGEHGKAEDSERWRAHPLFRELLVIRGRPTETQVIDALLRASEDRAGQLGVTRAVEQAVGAARLCLDYRPNFAGLGRVADQLAGIATSDDDDEAWRRWRAYLETRRTTTRLIAEKASATVGDAQRLMLYSQSQRVIDMIRDLQPRKRAQITLIVPECRSKSPAPFQNALLIAERVADAGFRSIEFTADMVAIHLIMTGRVDMILMGAHKVFVPKGSTVPIAVVNAVGSEAVTVAAEQAGVPVVFVFEPEKIVYIETQDEVDDQVSYDAECDISVPLRSDAAGGTDITWTQVGYDLVPWRPNMRTVVGS